MTLGTYLLHLRRKHNLSQKDVAAAINAAQSTYCDWESDTRFPKMIYFQRLAQLYEIQIDSLIACHSNPTSNINSSVFTNEKAWLLTVENQRLLEIEKEQQKTINTLMAIINRMSKEE
ncbi:helix-turn-helix transcriptional regulator [Runella sp.]|uniref:helix-turn-helix domain-containing protein n=1 Tax=Runella sp. TaxID=1960881 RepID=UPI00301AB529